MLLDHELVGVSSSPATADLYAALNAAQRRYTAIRRSGHNREAGYRFATLRDICDAVMPGLLANGFCMPTFQTGWDKNLGRWVLVGTLTHHSGQWISAVCPLLLGLEDSRAGIQHLEIDATYARKILMQGLCGGWMEPDEGATEEDQLQQQVTYDVALDSPAPAPELPKPVKQRKPGSARGVVKVVEEDPLKEEVRALLTRADEALSAARGDEPKTQKILDHLAMLVEQGRLPKAEVLALIKKHGAEEPQGVSTDAE